MTTTKEHRQRWIACHPEKARRQNRLKSARRRQAERTLRSRHRAEYERLVAAQAAAGVAGFDRYRWAMRDLRIAHPDEWRTILAGEA